MPREIEPLGNHSLENGAERENYWLASFINPAKIEKVSKAYKDRSKEWIIMEALQAKIIVKGPDLDPPIVVRLRNLLAAFRMLAYTNFTSAEQERLGKVAKAPFVRWSENEIEITTDLQSDVKWLWETFGLRVPGVVNTLLPRIAQSQQDPNS